MVAEVEVESGTPRAGRDAKVEPVGPVGLAELFDDLVDRFDRVRQRPAVAVAIGMLVLVSAAALWWSQAGATRAPVEELIPFVDPELATAAAPSDAAPSDAAPADAAPSDAAPAGGSPDGRSLVASPVVVHVVGAVVRPGLVELSPDSRVADAVEAAGGATGDGDPHRLNLAAPVVDGLRIRVPRFGEDAEGGSVADPLLSLPSTEVGSAGSLGQAVGPAAAGPVDLNTAGADRLESLPGIGPVTAAAIVEWRNEHGPFLAVDDLLSVPGIGPAKLEGLRDQVIV